MLTGTAGVVPDAPLTPRGRTQAAMAGEVLASESITRIYSSTAIRASATAAIIADVLGVEAIQRPELLEVNIGVAEGSTDPAIRARTAAVLRDWIVERDLSARVADGETGYQVVARVCAALTAIAGNHQDQTVAIVGHVASSPPRSTNCASSREPSGAPNATRYSLPGAAGRQRLDMRLVDGRLTTAAFAAGNAAGARSNRPGRT